MNSHAKLELLKKEIWEYIDKLNKYDHDISAKKVSKELETIVWKVK